MDVDLLRERLDAERTTNRLQKDMLKALEDQVRQLKTRLGQTNVEPRLTRQCFDFDEPEPQQTLTKSNVQGLYTTIQEQSKEINRVKEIANSTISENAELREMAKSLDEINQTLMADVEELKYEVDDRCNTIKNLNRLIEIQNNQIKDLNNQHTQQSQENKQPNRLWSSNGIGSTPKKNPFQTKSHLAQQPLNSSLYKQPRSSQPIDLIQDNGKLKTYIDDYDDFVDAPFNYKPSHLQMNHADMRTTEVSRKGKTREEEHYFEFENILPESLIESLPKVDSLPNVELDVQSLSKTESRASQSPKAKTSVKSQKRKASLPLVYIDDLSQESTDEPVVNTEPDKKIKTEEEVPSKVPLSCTTNQQQQPLTVVPSNTEDLVSKVQAQIRNQILSAQQGKRKYNKQEKHKHDKQGETCVACEKFYGTEEFPDVRDNNKMITPQERLGNHSRHRARARTPPGFWEMSFPPSQS